MTDIYYTPKELARILKVNVRTIAKMIKNKRIIAVNCGTEKRALWRVSDGDLQRFMAENYEKLRNN